LSIPAASLLTFTAATGKPVKTSSCGRRLLLTWLKVLVSWPGWRLQLLMLLLNPVPYSRLSDTACPSPAHGHSYSC